MPAARSQLAAVRRPVAKRMPHSKIGNRQRHRPCSPAANHFIHSDHSCGHSQVAILGSPVHERAFNNAIVTEEPFFVSTNSYQPIERFSESADETDAQCLRSAAIRRSGRIGRSDGRRDRRFAGRHHHRLRAGRRHKEIIPCLEVADARAAAEQFPAEGVLLGGEREGLPIEGFQLGNSPEKYTPERVGGKTVIFTTTNGTRAMNHARQADEIIIAAFVNAGGGPPAVRPRAGRYPCAGTDGRIGQDDVLLAGLLVERLEREGGMVDQQNTQAITAREFWLNSFALPQALGAEPLEADRLAGELHKSLGGQNLTAWVWTRTSGPPPRSTASTS